MKKKIIIFGFLALIAATLALGVFYAVESYRFDMDPANGIDIMEGLGAALILIVTGLLLVYEIDLFYTVYYFFVLPKTKVKSILNICAQLSLVLMYLYARFDCDFLPEELFWILPLAYVLLRLTYVAFSMHLWLKED